MWDGDLQRITRFKRRPSLVYVVGVSIAGTTAVVLIIGFVLSLKTDWCNRVEQ
jgi:hypothetical protein